MNWEKQEAMAQLSTLAACILPARYAGGLIVAIT